MKRKSTTPTGDKKTLQPASLPAQPPQPVTELGKLLGTDDPAQQLPRVSQLLQLAQVPLLTMVIQLDQRNGTCTISASDSAGQALPFEVGQRLLDAGRQALTQLQVQAASAATLPKG